MSWMQTYRSRLKPVQEAVGVIKDRDKVYVGSGCAAPHELIEGLTLRAEELHDVEIIHHLTLGDVPYLAPEMKGHFRLNDCFVGANTRQAVNEGRADYVPVHLHEMARLFRRGQYLLCTIRRPGLGGGARSCVRGSTHSAAAV